MLNFKKTLLTSSLAVTLLLIPIYVSANGHASNASNIRHNINAKQVKIRTQYTINTNYTNSNQMQLGSIVRKCHHTYRINHSHIVKLHHFIHTYLLGHGSDSMHQDMKASRMTHHKYFYREFLRLAPRYYSDEDPSHNMGKQLRVSWKILTHLHTQPKLYREGWYAINSTPKHYLRHNKMYYRGFRDSIHFKRGLGASVKGYFHEYMAVGKIKD